MQRLKPEDGVSLGEMGVSEEDEKRQARIAVITNLAMFAGIVLALRMGKVYSVMLNSANNSCSIPHRSFSVEICVQSILRTRNQKVTKETVHEYSLILSQHELKI